MSNHIEDCPLALKCVGQPFPHLKTQRICVYCETECTCAIIRPHGERMWDLALDAVEAEIQAQLNTCITGGCPTCDGRKSVLHGMKHLYKKKAEPDDAKQ